MVTRRLSLQPLLTSSHQRRLTNGHILKRAASGLDVEKTMNDFAVWL